MRAQRPRNRAPACMSNTIPSRSIERAAVPALEVAALLAISPRHLWQLDKLGRVPRPIRLGRSVRWHRRELEAWLAAGGPPRDQWEVIKQAVSA